MGMTYIEGTVRGSDGEEEPVKLLVDSGAMYTLLPKSTWENIGLTQKRVETFVMVDGTEIRRGISECHLTLPQGAAHTPVILGEEGDEALLGVVTLEILGLVLNPFNRTLQHMRMRLT